MERVESTWMASACIFTLPVSELMVIFSLRQSLLRVVAILVSLDSPILLAFFASCVLRSASVSDECAPGIDRDA